MDKEIKDMDDFADGIKAQFLIDTIQSESLYSLWAERTNLVGSNEPNQSWIASFGMQATANTEHSMRLIEYQRR